MFSEGGIYGRPPVKPIAGLKLRSPQEPTQWGPGVMIRNKRWKLTSYAFDTGELFDLAHDPHETNNLFADPNYREIKETMMHRLSIRQMCLGADPDDLPRFIPKELH